MANKDLVNRRTIGSAIDKDVHKMLKEYSQKSGIPISRILDRAIIAYLKTVN